jgi:hypothetical protein
MLLEEFPLIVTDANNAENVPTMEEISDTVN